MSSDASCIAPRLDAANALRADRSPAPGRGPGWRLPATVVLMLLTLPVFAIAAVACLPVLLLALAVRSLLPVLRLLPTRTPHPARAR